MSEKKSNFSVTCSLLSQFLKGKRSFGDLGVIQEPTEGIFRPPITMNLLPGVDVSAENQTDTPETHPVSDRNTAKSVGLFPQQTGFTPADKKTDTKEPEKSQLTIFYGGKVLVFDNFPAEKANDLVQLAAKGSSAASAAAAAAAAAPSNTSALADRPPVSCPSTSGSKPTPAQLNPDLPMPIARRASLHRFFEKRKDRINSKAPYQVNEHSSHGQGDSSKPDETRSWLGLGQDVSNASMISD